MTDKTCAEGHVIEESRETCSRCNGLPVQNEAPVAFDTDTVAEAPVAEEKKIDEATEDTTENIPVEPTPEGEGLTTEEAEANAVADGSTVEDEIEA